MPVDWFFTALNISSYPSKLLFLQLRFRFLGLTKAIFFIKNKIKTLFFDEKSRKR